MKKQLLATAALAVLGSSSMFGQSHFVKTQKKIAVQTETSENMIVKERCSTVAPGDDWDVEFNKLVEKYKAEHTDPTGRLSVTNYSIPVIIHIIHGGQAVGTYPNISNAQAVSQINVLNADYGGTGLNSGNVPAAFAGLVANTGIQFCLAQKDPNGNTLTETGIHRVDYNTFTVSGSASKNPASTTYNTPTLFQNFINNTVKPQTIWDPTKYMNIWVTDEANSVGLLGFGSFPAGSTLSGLSAPFGSATTDGLWCWGRSFGNTGSVQSPYNKGRTATHEIGHWLGLRHIWGDNGQCGATDYCVDTPPQKGQASNQPFGCWYGTPTYPQNAGQCTRPDGASGANVTNTNGDMFMNFMDYTDDIAMYMFTPDQAARMQTAMANGTYRSALGTHGICNVTPTAPTAAFTMATTGCAGTAVTVTNTSSGSPTPTYSWTTSPSTGVTINTATSTNPSITFANPGTYTVSVTATNAQGNNSTNHTITISTCSVTSCDTLYNIDPVNDQITIYGAQSGGYLSGTSGYPVTYLSEYYTQPGLTGSSLTGMMTLFFSDLPDGTQGTGNIAFEAYGATGTGGAPGATPLRTDNVTLSTVMSNGAGSGGIFIYGHTFSTPVTLTANAFHVAIKLPTTAAAGDTVAVLSDTMDAHPTNTAWLKFSGTWASADQLLQGSTWSFCMFPFICPASVGLAASELNSQISVFPNPSSGIVNFAYTLHNQSDLKIDVTNMLGQSVYSSVEKAATAGTKTIDLSGVSKGVYMITVSTGTDKMVRKVVID